jgi:nucleotide-binding universal stress UspA family protein
MRDDRIVVGVDGSDGGRRALRWAVHEAAARGQTVQAVTAWRWDRADRTSGASVDPGEERARAERILHDELAAVSAGDVVIAAEAVEGRAADVLCAASQNAHLLVLGSHGHGRTMRTVLGSVSEECVRRGPCPVVVIPVPSPAPTHDAPLAVRR